jgi:hypothetical protein
MSIEESIQKSADTSELLAQDLRELAFALCAGNTPQDRIAWQHAMMLLEQSVNLRQKIKALKP